MEFECPQFIRNEKEDLLYTVVVIDGMPTLQAFDIKKSKNSAELEDGFVSHIMGKHSQYNEIRIIFDRYDLEKSLKESTRKSRLCRQILTFYKISDATPLKKSKMKTLL